jgi:hypothetical protein
MTTEVSTETLRTLLRESLQVASRINYNSTLLDYGLIYAAANGTWQPTEAGVALLEDENSARSSSIDPPNPVAAQQVMSQDLLNAQIRNALDEQIGGDHYSKLGKYQPWEVLAHWLTPEELRGYMKGTIIAYLAREGDKGGDTDIAKALHTGQLWQEVRKDK